jgi:hypothetical protein
MQLNRDVRRRLAEAEGRMRLNLHLGSGRNAQDPVEREDSSAAQAEDAKFED